MWDDVDGLHKLRKGLDSRLRQTEIVKMALGRSEDAKEKQKLIDRYVLYLSRVAAQYSPHSPIVMALAASRCLASHPEMANYLLHHAGEEQGHDSWAFQDLGSLGLTSEKIRSANAVPSCEAMIGYTYYIAGHANPVGLFGWMYILEAVGDDLGREAAHGIRQNLGLAEDGVLFVAGHGEADKVHIKELEEQIAKYGAKGQDRADILRVAEVSAELYLRMFQEVDAGS
jgi:pyrroloquinoline quinone (PQQ) biosynthesis protein C